MVFNTSMLGLLSGNERNEHNDAAGGALYWHPLILTFGDMVWQVYSPNLTARRIRLAFVILLPQDAFH
ncbi:hypothetical protein ACO0LB_00590 [Undibacterium sp. SXout7W]|uniref:hypothetical protein n=1 Tax=Undibacterium sp. SXout7W TaxID=3413049 RepID=UPI003BF2FBD9